MADLTSSPLGRAGVLNHVVMTSPGTKFIPKRCCLKNFICFSFLLKLKFEAAGSRTVVTIFQFEKPNRLRNRFMVLIVY